MFNSVAPGALVIGAPSRPGKEVGDRVIEQRGANNSGRKVMDDVRFVREVCWCNL